MELRQLLIFRTAAQTLNFTKAATKLGYAQSKITSQICLLEEELHVKLFERFGRGIKLTSEGRRFLENAELILQQCEKAKAEFTPDVVRGVLNHHGKLIELNWQGPKFDVKTQLFTTGRNGFRPLFKLF